MIGLASGSTALFTERRVMLPNAKLQDIKTSTAGNFKVDISSSDVANVSSQQDWGGGGSIGYAVFSISASQDESRKIQDDFNGTTKITLSCESLMAIDYIANAWFNPNIFNNSLIKTNMKAFERFFGPQGSLLYYPDALVIMRGLKVTFHKEANWTYDYDSLTRRSGGGGVSIFGITFGGSASSVDHYHEHKIQNDGLDLSFSDGPDTVRVIGYVAQKNADLAKAIMQPMNRYPFAGSSIGACLGLSSCSFSQRRSEGAEGMDITSCFRRRFHTRSAT